MHIVEFDTRKQYMLDDLFDVTSKLGSGAIDMKVLLDTSIVIHREAATVNRSDIGILFRWLDSLHYEKCIHPLTINEIRRHDDPRVVRTFENKLQSYHTLRTTAPDDPAISAIRTSFDVNDNDANDSTLLNELASRRVDLFITEDRRIHLKSTEIGLGHKVFTIDSFLEKVTAEHPESPDYRVLAVKKEYFGNIRGSDPFFDTFREDYPGFDGWFNSKSDEHAYYCVGERGEVVAFLYLKLEGPGENYSDVDPIFSPKSRLKIGTFKVTSNGYKLGERFIKIIFDNAVLFDVDEIYVTMFDQGDNRLRLISLLSDWGFTRHGQKRSEAGIETVFVRPCSAEWAMNSEDPRLTFPYAKGQSKKFIVPIYPQYHTELFPDSILRTESPDNFVENAPNRNALSKVYISRSIEMDLRSGDMVVFYRTRDRGPAWHTSVTTTLGVIESVVTNIRNVEEFIELCRKRSVFSDQELVDHWDRNPRNRPFVVNFIYLYSLPRRMNLRALVEAGIIDGEAPRGFEQMSDAQFERLLEGSGVSRRITVD